MIRRLPIIVLPVAVLAGCAMPPKGVDAQNIAEFETAVASIGCTMVGESDYLPVELQTGLTREQVIGLLEFKLAAKEAAKLSNGGVELKTGACA